MSHSVYGKRTAKPIPTWLRDRTPGLAEGDTLNDEILCTRQLPSGRRERGSLYFISSRLIYSGSTHLVLLYDRIEPQSSGSKQVVLRYTEDGEPMKHVFIPEEPRHCESIIRAIQKAKVLGATGGSNLGASGDGAMSRTHSLMHAPIHPPANNSFGHAAHDAVSLAGKDAGDEKSDAGEDLPGSLQAALDSVVYTMDRKVFSPVADVKGGTLVGSFNLSVGVQAAIDAVLGSQSSFMHEYHKKLDDIDMSVGRWGSDSRIGGTRTFKCKTATPFGVTPFYEAQRYVLHKDDSDRTCGMYHGSAQCPKTSYGECFRVETAVFFNPERTGCRVCFYGFLRWESKPAFIRGMIQSSVDNRLPKSFSAFRDVAVDLCRRVPPKAAGGDAAKEPKAKTPLARREERMSPLNLPAPPEAFAAPPPPAPAPAPSAPPVSEQGIVAGVAVAVMVLLCIMCFWTSRSLAHAEGLLEQAELSSPERLLQDTLGMVAARRPALLALKALLASDTAGLAALPPSEARDFRRRLQDVKAALAVYGQHAQRMATEEAATPNSARADPIPDVAEPRKEPQAADGYGQQAAAAPARVRDVHRQDAGSQAQLVAYEERQAADSEKLQKLHRALLAQMDTINQEHNDVIFRLRIVALLAFVTLVCSVKFMISGSAD